MNDIFLPLYQSKVKPNSSYKAFIQLVNNIVGQGVELPKQRLIETNAYIFTFMNSKGIVQIRFNTVNEKIFMTNYDPKTI